MEAPPEGSWKRDDNAPEAPPQMASDTATPRVTKTRNIIALALIVLSFAVLYPGLTGELITITASWQVFGRTIELFNQTRSIIQSIRSLHESGNDFVAGLILLFSVVVPFVKGLFLVLVMIIRAPAARYSIFGFVRNISKWAMADVFVVGVYVAFLSARATDGLDAELGRGFYYFVAYCLVSLLALQFMKVDNPQEARASAVDPARGVTPSKEEGGP